MHPLNSSPNASSGSPLSRRAAIGLALAAYTFWVLADTSLKMAGSSRLSAYEVIATVGLVEVLLLLAYSLARGDVRHLWPRSPPRQCLRSCLDLANNLCVVVALRHLPLALFYILVFLAPLVTVVLAALFLREPVGLRRAFAIFVGFFGVLVAVHPTRGSLRPGYAIGYLACLVCVLCFSTNIVWSRVLTQSEAPESMTFFSGLTMLVFGSVLAVPHFEPVNLHLAAQLTAVGLFSLGGSLCFFLALKNTAAANVVPYHYSQLVTGAALAFLIWRERPTVNMWAGAVLIAGAGYWTASLRDGAASKPTADSPTQPAAAP